MQLAGGNPDLGAHTELTPIGKLGRGVVHHDRAVDLGEKLRCGTVIFAQNAFGMLRAILADMGDGRVDIIDHARRDDMI